MAFNFAKILLESKEEYNGHLQTTVSKLSIEEGIEICKELEEYCDYEYSFVCEVYVDKGFTILQKDYWRPGEHPLGYTDRIILGVGE